MYGGSSTKLVGPNSWVTWKPASGHESRAPMSARPAARLLLGGGTTARLGQRGLARRFLRLELLDQPVRRLLLSDAVRERLLRVAGPGGGGVERGLLLAPLLLGCGLELGQALRHRTEIGLALGEELLLRLGRHARLVQRRATLLQRALLRGELVAQCADLVGEALVVVGHGEEVADLGRGLVERAGAQQHLEQ